MIQRQTVYGLFDPATDELRYVGTTWSLKARLQAHRITKVAPVGLWVQALDAAGTPVVVRELGQPWRHPADIRWPFMGERGHEFERAIIRQHASERLFNIQKNPARSRAKRAA